MQQQDEYGTFCARVKQLTGMDLNGYKEKQMRRRLESQMARRGLVSFLAYYELLAKDKLVLQEFLDRVTINVSEFFRNAERWQVLKEKVLPALLSRRESELRVWSAACSTGEEPYSLAMLLQSDFAQSRWKISATDIDETVLGKAKAGEYQLAQLAQIPERYQRHLKKGDKSFTVGSELKSGVEFRQHDLLREAFPEQLDLIVCRNVMIYFTDDIKHRLYGNFAASLRMGGILFVGSTEQIFRAKEYGFQAFDSFFYQKTE